MPAPRELHEALDLLADAIGTPQVRDGQIVQQPLPGREKLRPVADALLRIHDDGQILLARTVVSDMAAFMGGISDRAAQQHGH